MKDRDLHTRDADEILWSDKETFSDAMRRPVKPEEIQEPEPTESDRWVAWLIFWIAVAMVVAWIVVRWQVLGGR